MNDGQGAQQKTPAGGRIKLCILCVTLMLVGVGTAYAAGDNQGASSDEGIPGVLKYAQQYQREKGTSSGEQKRQASSERSGVTGSAELRRRLTMREQELRQLKKENQSLRGRLETLSVAVQKVDEDKDKDRQIAELKLALDGSKKQNDERVRKAEKVQEALSQQVSELKQQLARADSGNKTTTEQMEKEKAELVSSLNALKKEMTEMPLVTPELLKTDNRVLLAGIRDALNRKVLLNESTLDSALQKAEEVAQKARLAVIREQKKAGAAYLDKFRKRKDVKQAESGFWYRTEYTGDGEFIRGDDTLVDVVVTEKLTDGTVIEDMDARGRVISQTLGDYPPLFREALMLLKNHGTAELVVPSELAYGDEGDPPRVPPGATMLYTLRVEDVKPAAGDTQGVSSEAGKKITEKGAEGDNK